MKFFHSDSTSLLDRAVASAVVIMVLQASAVRGESGGPAESNGIPPAEEEEQQSAGSQLSVCIDDSDCKKLGQGNLYACFSVRK